MQHVIQKLNQVRTPHLWLNPHKCKACWQCIQACPNDVLGKVKFLWHKHIIVKDSKACCGCGKCAKVCGNACFLHSKTTDRHGIL